jgi:ribose transport system permease protein/inositol transport system permease protein
VFGRRVYAVGGNETAAKVSGISVERIKLAVYTLCGFLAGIAGILLASRIISGNPTSGQAYELDAIAAVIIGGVSMSGGAGKWYGTVIGALLIAVISNGLDILNVSSHFQLIIKGLIIIVAVLIDIKGKAKQ